MISPELLRNFHHFSGVSYECLKKISMISKEKELDPGMPCLMRVTWQPTYV